MSPKINRSSTINQLYLWCMVVCWAKEQGPYRWAYRKSSSFKVSLEATEVHKTGGLAEEKKL
jgi:hypothetical protein